MQGPYEAQGTEGRGQWTKVHCQSWVNMTHLTTRLPVATCKGWVSCLATISYTGWETMGRLHKHLQGPEHAVYAGNRMTSDSEVLTWERNYNKQGGCNC